MEPYHDFKASIDYRLKASIDFYRLKLLQTFNGNHKPNSYLDRVKGEARVSSRIGYVYLGVQISKGTVQWQPHQLI